MPKTFFQSGLRFRTSSLDVPCGAWKLTMIAPAVTRRILVSLLHTDLSWDELSKENVETAACDNGLCPQRGLLQKLKPSRVALGSLNPV
jgi:hypothetical protein